MELRQEHGEALLWLKESWLWDRSLARMTASPVCLSFLFLLSQGNGELS